MASTSRCRRADPLDTKCHRSRFLICLTRFAPPALGARRLSTEIFRQRPGDAEAFGEAEGHQSISFVAPAPGHHFLSRLAHGFICPPHAYSSLFEANLSKGFWCKLLIKKGRRADSGA